MTTASPHWLPRKTAWRVATAPRSHRDPFGARVRRRPRRPARRPRPRSATRAPSPRQAPPPGLPQGQHCPHPLVVHSLAGEPKAAPRDAARGLQRTRQTPTMSRRPLAKAIGRGVAVGAAGVTGAPSRAATSPVVITVATRIAAPTAGTRTAGTRTAGTRTAGTSAAIDRARPIATTSPRRSTLMASWIYVTRATASCAPRATSRVATTCTSRRHRSGASRCARATSSKARLVHRRATRSTRRCCGSMRSMACTLTRPASGSGSRTSLRCSRTSDFAWKSSMTRHCSRVVSWICSLRSAKVSAG